MLESGVAPMSTESVTGLTQRLYHEARLLDAERFEDWLECMCNDVTYRMELKRRRFRADRSPPAAVGVGVVFNENLARLKLRIDRLRSGFVWAEDPPNFVRRVVSNVEVERADDRHPSQPHRRPDKGSYCRALRSLAYACRWLEIGGARNST